jgi:hypothetical protein
MADGRIWCKPPACYSSKRGEELYEHHVYRITGCEAIRAASTEYIAPTSVDLVLCFCLIALPPERELVLHGMKNPFSEKGKSSSAIALSFDQFELGHMPFDHTIVDPPSEACSYSVFVFFHPSSKRLQFGNVAPLHLDKPRIQVLSLALA